MARKSLADILANSERERLERTWSTIKAANDLTPIPGGEYRARVINGELFTAKTGTAGYKITLEVLGGEHAGRLLWHDVWLSEAALAMAKRDLHKLGIEDFSQLNLPLPDGIIVVARVAMRRRDDGTEFNRVVRFDVVAVEPPAPEPFAPDADEPGPAACDADGFNWRNGTPAEGPTP